MRWTVRAARPGATSSGCARFGYPDTVLGVYVPRKPVLALCFALPMVLTHLPSASDPSPRVRTTAPVGGDARTVLESLTVAPEHRGGYKRSLFEHWATLPDGCSVRERVLLDESTTAVSVSSRYCTVRAGRWVSVYDAKVLTSPRDVQIDHVVALREAWDSGAYAWTPATRRAFANDLVDPATLRAVSASSNESKSDKDPAQWLPPARAAWCRYAADWVRIKATWRLTVDRAERDTLRRVLANC